MSDEWADALVRRLDRIDSLQNDIDDLYDPFMGHEENDAVEAAQDALGRLRAATQRDVDVILVDWSLIESHADDIISYAEEIAEVFVDAGLLEPDGHGHWDVAVDNPPDILVELNDYLTRTIDDWYEVRNDASDMMDAEKTIPRRHKP